MHSEFSFYYGNLGTVSNEDALAYASVISEAFDIHVDRERIRNGLWKQYVPADQVRQIRIKVERVDHSLRSETSSEDHWNEIEGNIVEEMLDIINYSVFTVRLLRGDA